jgi:hypothetical protein
MAWRNLGVVAVSNSWITFLVVWVFPLTILYQISSTLRLCVEHHFPKNEQPFRDKKDYGRLTVGVFLGEPVPQVSGISPESFLKWGIWWLSRN